MSLFSKATMAVTSARPVEKLITGTRPGKAVAGKFVAGDTLDEAVGIAHQLNRDGFSVSLDLLGEAVVDRESARLALDEYLESLDRIAAEGLDANVSVKPTQLGLSIDESLALDAIDELGRKASEVGTTVTIDMEDSHYTDATIRLFEAGQAQHQNMGIAVQAYLHRTPDDLARCLRSGGHIRLCKGAYVEDEDVAIQEFDAINEAYRKLLETLMADDDVKPAIATHNEGLLAQARRLADDRDGEFEFQMLFGVRSDLQRELISDGFPVRIYLPFGSQWYPYLTRRLAERPANALFFLKALVRG